MDYHSLIDSLKEAQEHLALFEKQQEDLIKEEVAFYYSFINKIAPFATQKTINGERAVLIFLFGEDNKELISHEVYLTDSGYATYQVYNEEMYKGYRRDADIRSGYCRVPLTEFMKKIPLKELLSFFEHRPGILIERTENLIQSIRTRKEFLKNNV